MDPSHEGVTVQLGGDAGPVHPGEGVDGGAGDPFHQVQQGVRVVHPAVQGLDERCGVRGVGGQRDQDGLGKYRVVGRCVRGVAAGHEVTAFRSGRMRSRRSVTE